jgi:hypothetical protein
MYLVRHEMDCKYLHDKEIDSLQEYVEKLQMFIENADELNRAERELQQQRYDSLLEELHRMEDWWSTAICYVQLLGGKLHEYPLGDMTEEERVRQLADYEEKWQLNYPKEQTCSK